MKKTHFLTALLSALLMGATGAWAHDDAYLDTLKAPHGGQLRMAGLYHYELVLAKDATAASAQPIVVYVTDHAGQKIPTAGATGTATVLAAKAKTTLVLAPDGDNRLKGVGRYASAPDMKALVSITLQGQAPEQARFTPLSTAPHADHMP